MPLRLVWDAATGQRFDAPVAESRAEGAVPPSLFGGTALRYRNALRHRRKRMFLAVTVLVGHATPSIHVFNALCMSGYLPASRGVIFVSAPNLLAAGQLVQGLRSAGFRDYAFQYIGDGGGRGHEPTPVEVAAEHDEKVVAFPVAEEPAEEPGLEIVPHDVQLLNKSDLDDQSKIRRIAFESGHTLYQRL